MYEMDESGMDDLEDSDEKGETNEWMKWMMKCRYWMK